MYCNIASFSIKEEGLINIVTSAFQFFSESWTVTLLQKKLIV